MAEIYHRVLDRFGMPVELALNIVVPVFKGNGHVKNYRAVKLLEHRMKVVERVLKQAL